MTAKWSLQGGWGKEETCGNTCGNVRWSQSFSRAFLFIHSFLQVSLQMPKKICPKCWTWIAPDHRKPVAPVNTEQKIVSWHGVSHSRSFVELWSTNYTSVYFHFSVTFRVHSISKWYRTQKKSDSCPQSISVICHKPQPTVHWTLRGETTSNIAIKSPTTLLSTQTWTT